MLCNFVVLFSMLYARISLAKRVFLSTRCLALSVPLSVRLSVFVFVSFVGRWEFHSWNANSCAKSRHIKLRDRHSYREYTDTTTHTHTHRYISYSFGIWMNEASCKASGATNLAIKYGNETPAMHHASNQAEGQGKRWREGGYTIRAPAKSVVCLVCLSVCVCVCWFSSLLSYCCCFSFASCLIFHLHFCCALCLCLLHVCIFRLFQHSLLTFDMHTISSNFSSAQPKQTHTHTASLHTHTHTSSGVIIEGFSLKFLYSLC